MIRRGLSNVKPAAAVPGHVHVNAHVRVLPLVVSYANTRHYHFQSQYQYRGFNAVAPLLSFPTTSISANISSISNNISISTRTFSTNSNTSTSNNMLNMNTSTRPFSTNTSNITSTSNTISNKVDVTNFLLLEVGVGEMSRHQLEQAKSLIYHFAKQQTHKSATVAELLLERVVTEATDGCNIYANDVITTKQYNIVLDSLGKTNNLQKAEALLYRMNKRYTIHHSNSHSHSNAHSHSHTTHSNSIKRQQPDIITYNTLLFAYSQEHKPSEQTVQKAEQIIQDMQNQTIHIQPDTSSYNMLMNVYANQIGKYGYAQKAEDVLLYMSQLRKEGDDMVHPDTKSFNIVLKTWKNSGGGIESAQRAEEILRLMIKLYLEGHTNVKPDGISFSTVIHAYIKPHHHHHHHHQEHNNNNIALLNTNVIKHLNNIIDLLLNESGDIPFTTKGIVTKTFNAIISCIAKSNNNSNSNSNADSNSSSSNSSKGVGEKTHALLQRFITAHEQGHIQDTPDVKTYSNVIGAYAKDNNPKQALQLLQQMIDGHSYAYVKPNAYCFNKCLHLASKSNDVDTAELLYQNMIDLANGKIDEQDHHHRHHHHHHLQIRTQQFFSSFFSSYLHSHPFSLSQQHHSH